MKKVFNKGANVLFYGDSVTDCGRNFDDLKSLGDGYAAKLKSIYDVLFENNGVNFYNKGISGNRAVDLLQRYETDVLSLKPDYMTILIGVNDTWRRYDNNDPTDHEVFSNTYRSLLEKIKADMPACKIMIIEPFLLDSDPEKIVMWEDLNPKIEKIKVLAKEFADFYLPVNELFANAVKNDESCHQSLAEDGVHPTTEGHARLALAVLECFGVL